MTGTYSPHREEEAAISKDAILIQQLAKYQQANQCIPVLWKKFVLPTIQAKLGHTSLPRVRLSEQTLNDVLKNVVTDATERQLVILLLRRYDYIRLNTDNSYTTGTRLWTEVDAGRMLAALQKKTRPM